MDINVMTCGPNTRTCRSLFRYQGGKSRLCKNLVSLFPQTFNAYIEPFVGAGKQPVGELVIANFEPEARAAGKFEVAA